MSAVAQRRALPAGALLLVIAAVLWFPGHIGSGRTVSEVRALPAFSAVELAGANDVTVHVGQPRRVAVRAEREALRHVTTTVREGRLVIANRGAVKSHKHMSVTVDVPSLRGVTLSGAGRMTIDGLRGSRLEATLPGSGLLTATGTAGRLDATMGGSGELELAGVVANDVRALMSGTGDIHVFARRSLTATVSGTGSIRYAGNPARVSRDVTGTGAIIPG